MTRLFCFHHAGGSASAFAALRKTLAAEVDVVPVQLPARERRLRDPLPSDMADLVTELDEQLDPFLRQPYAFYGHSMGALIAYEIIRRRRERLAGLPVRLLTGGCRAPHLPAAFVSAHSEPDESLLNTMLDIGGVSPYLLEYPEWLRAALSLTRNDLRLCASRTDSGVDPLPIPIDAFYGTDDPLVSADDAAAWQSHTTESFALHAIRGDHFFLLRDSSAVFAARLSEVLAHASGGDPVGAR
jgi:surfactin synthase thioesterase subunit